MGGVEFFSFPKIGPKRFSVRSPRFLLKYLKFLPILCLALLTQFCVAPGGSGPALSPVGTDAGLSGGPGGEPGLGVGQEAQPQQPTEILVPKPRPIPVFGTVILPSGVSAQDCHEMQGEPLKVTTTLTQWSGEEAPTVWLLNDPKNNYTVDPCGHFTHEITFSKNIEGQCRPVEKVRYQATYELEDGTFYRGFLTVSDCPDPIPEVYELKKIQLLPVFMHNQEDPVLAID